MARRRWPAEWEPHSACLILWPHNPGTFRLEAARAEFTQLIRTIAEHGGEDVIVVCHSAEMKYDVSSRLATNHIRTIVCASNDSWVRDTGPIFVMDPDYILGLDFWFNAYGGPNDGCYWPCELDRCIAKNICRTLSYKVESHDDFIVEGGSIHTDGQGTILTTKECLLNPNRNVHLTQVQIERKLLEITGCSKIIWLDTGLAGDDDTNGHIDNFCCFVEPASVVLAWTDDERNENYHRCRHALSILETSVDAKGRSLTIHKLLLPKPMYYSADEIASLTFGDYNETIVFPRTKGDPMAASYVNFYIANACVAVPQFGDVQRDAQALQTLQEVFPSRRVIGIPSREILIGGGNLHCVTQQVPTFVSDTPNEG